MLSRVAQHDDGPRPRGIAYIHIGTHKTGTTAIQRLLADNQAAFESAGIMLPHTGRIDPTLAAQHNIAYYLTHNPLYEPAHGTFVELGAEIEARQPDVICLSSEEFGSLAVNRGGMLRLFAGLNSVVEYEPRIIIYLRPQVDMIESLFAELVKHEDPPPFSTFVENMLTNGRYDEARLVYTDVLDAFAERFGAHRLIVRPYIASSDPTALLRDFVSIVAPSGFDFDQLTLPPRMNERLAFSSVMARMRSNADAARDAQPFEPLTLADIGRVVTRFLPDNVRLNRRYGVFIPPVSQERLSRAITRAFQPASAAESQRKELDALGAKAPRVSRRIETVRSDDESYGRIGSSST
jgi:hypothetical protein